MEKTEVKLEIPTSPGKDKEKSAISNYIIFWPVGKFEGHKHFVKLGTLASDGSLFTGSSDNSLMSWNTNSFERKARYNKQHTDGIRSLCVINGYVFSSAKDKSIRVWSAEAPEEGIDAPQLCSERTGAPFVCSNGKDRIFWLNEERKFVCWKVGDSDDNSTPVNTQKIEAPKSDKPAKFAADKLTNMLYYEHQGRRYLLFIFPNEITAISIEQEVPVPKDAGSFASHPFLHTSYLSGRFLKVFKYVGDKPPTIVATTTLGNDYLAILFSNGELQLLKFAGENNDLLFTNVTAGVQKRILESKTMVITSASMCTFLVTESDASTRLTPEHVFAGLTFMDPDSKRKSMAVIPLGLKMSKGETILERAHDIEQIIVPEFSEQDCFCVFGDPKNEFLYVCADRGVVKFAKNMQFTSLLAKPVVKKLDFTWEDISLAKMWAVCAANDAVYAASSDTNIYEWSTRDFRYRDILQGHTKKVNCLTYVPSRRVLLSGSDDYSIRIWDLSAPSENGTKSASRSLTFHNSEVVSVIYARDTIFSCSKDKLFVRWDYDTEEVLQIINLSASPDTMMLGAQNMTVTDDGININFELIAKTTLLRKEDNKKIFLDNLERFSLTPSPESESRSYAVINIREGKPGEQFFTCFAMFNGYTIVAMGSSIFCTNNKKSFIDMKDQNMKDGFAKLPIPPALHKIYQSAASKVQKKEKTVEGVLAVLGEDAKAEGVSCMLVDNNVLFVGFSGGKVEIFGISPDKVQEEGQKKRTKTLKLEKLFTTDDWLADEKFPVHAARVTSLSIVGDTLVSCAEDTNVFVWDLHLLMNQLRNHKYSELYNFSSLTFAAKFSTAVEASHVMKNYYKNNTDDENIFLKSVNETSPSPMFYALNEQRFGFLHSLRINSNSGEQKVSWKLNPHTCDKHIIKLLQRKVLAGDWEFLNETLMKPNTSIFDGGAAVLPMVLKAGLKSQPEKIIDFISNYSTEQSFERGLLEDLLVEAVRISAYSAVEILSDSLNKTEFLVSRELLSRNLNPKFVAEEKHKSYNPLPNFQRELDGIRCVQYLISQPRSQVDKDNLLLSKDKTRAVNDIEYELQERKRKLSVGQRLKKLVSNTYHSYRDQPYVYAQALEYFDHILKDYNNESEATEHSTDIIFGEDEDDTTQEEKEKKKYITHKNQRNKLDNLKVLTQAMNGLLLDMNKHYKVSQFRVGYALLFFISQFLPYLVFLGFVTYAAYGLTNGNNQDNFYFTDSLRNTFNTADFQGISSIPGTYDWLQNIFLPSVFSTSALNGTALDDTGVINTFQHVIGPVRIEQWRGKENTCITPEQTSVKFVAPDGPCIAYFEEDTNNWGTQNVYTPLPRVDYDGFISSEGVFSYPKAIVYETLPATLADAQAAINLYRFTGYLDDKTRAVRILAHLFNPSRDSIGAVSLVIEFLPSGRVIPRSDIAIFPFFRISAGEPIFLMIVLLCIAIYIFYTFILRELIQILNIFIKPGMKKRQKFIKFLNSYVLHPWNAMEWIIIALFITILVSISVRITIQNTIVGADLGIFIVALRNLATIYLKEKTIIVVFVMACYYRIFKFFKYAPVIGPVVTAVLDTLTNIKFTVFFMLYLITIYIFSLAFALQFGADISDFSFTTISFVRTFRVLLGDSNFGDMAAGDFYMASFLFIVFMLWTSLIWGNLLIAILSEIYGSFQDTNKGQWESMITHLLIKNWIVLPESKKAKLNGKILGTIGSRLTGLKMRALRPNAAFFRIVDLFSAVTESKKKARKAEISMSLIEQEGK